MPDASITDAAADDRDPLHARLVAELPGLRAFLRRRVAAGSGVEVDDVVQDVMARALRYLATFDASRAFQPWLRGMAWRVLADHRARRRAEPLPDDEPIDTNAATDAASSTFERRESIERALTALTPSERAILVRFHGDGESIRAIAESLRMPEGTVKSHLHRARRRLGDTP